MNEQLTKADDKRVTLQEIARITGAAYSTVAAYAQRAGWTENGKQTLLNMEQAAIIIEAMKQGDINGHDLPSRVADIETGINLRRMTIKEVADKLKCSPETIKNHIRDIFPKMMRNGTTTYLTERQATLILERMKHPRSSGALSNLQSEIVGIETSQSRALRMKLLHDEMVTLYEAEISELRADNAAMLPKAIFADAVSASENTILIGELAKIIRGNGVEIGQNRLFDWLRDNGYLIRRSGSDINMPTQRAMELGLFVIKETAVPHADGHVTIHKTPKVTGKGQQYFINLFLSLPRKAA